MALGIWQLAFGIWKMKILCLQGELTLIWLVTDGAIAAKRPSAKCQMLTAASTLLSSPCMKAHATNIVRELRQRGFQAYFAGGCVRDTLLGLVPADYDVATDATPQQVMRIFPQTYAVGAQFGVVLVPAPEDLPAPLTPSEHPNYVEVATFRNDGAYS